MEYPVKDLLLVCLIGWFALALFYKWGIYRWIRCEFCFTFWVHLAVSLDPVLAFSASGAFFLATKILKI